MTFDAKDSVTLKIWDRSTLHHTLDSAVQDLSARHNTTTCRVAVTCSGPNTFTLSLRGEAQALASA
ncbi:hypothetical protein D7Z96_17220 [Pseudarthrobacter phenanthrenivorans]|uniref:Uncharacterized protein n=2 Tax=Pseudarthrobacter phenanthrenivorans TaxID=361575 RepID=A0A3B0FR11_PSEPS|nr:hypothetical protein [Pseudarthrobacter phenanthrenivorans]ADX74505.1 hypothetical protein Asphe3_34000 [Pseudarthrobacter phenanthrenivorans Sphe3]RKO20947.1 hypothetical protein D7Z96_17220 [Pseudarthrobacter phenanthrenivorans]TPV48220.1 hypothetical protein FJ661_19345 [Pseudarthrobacter phenanthrenivorans]